MGWWQQDFELAGLSPIQAGIPLNLGRACLPDLGTVQTYAVSLNSTRTGFSEAFSPDLYSHGTCPNVMTGYASQQLLRAPVQGNAAFQTPPPCRFSLYV